MPLVSSARLPPFTSQSRLSVVRADRKAAVFCPFADAITSNDSAGIATLALRAMAARRCVCSSVSFSRPVR
jgi:hypothetical protein